MDRFRANQLGLLGLIVVVALAGCATLTPGRYTSMSRAEIAQTNRAFEEAANAGDAARLASLYTTDAMAFPPDAPMVQGQDNIKEMWASVLTGMGLKSVKLATLDLQIVGGTAYEVGEATLRLEPQGSTGTTAVVKYVVVWKKVDGQWRLHRDIWNGKPEQ